MRTPSYKKRRKASVISFSEQFNKDIRIIRSSLGIPTEGFNSSQAMNNWYRKHHLGSSKECYRLMPSYYWHFPKELVELIESYGCSDKPSRVNFYPDVPLDQYAMEIIRKYDLPEEILAEVKANILGAKGPLAIGPMLQLVLIPVNEGEDGKKFVALISGIDESSTQKDWLDIWRDIGIFLRLSGVCKTPPKRPIDGLFIRDLGFWKQIQEGKTAREIADDWVKKHPNEKDYPVEDMIRKAVARVESIMRPKS